MGWTAAQLRQVVLAVTVLDDIDLEPGDGGVVLRGDGAPVWVTWGEVAAAVGRAAGLEQARPRVRDYFAVRRVLDDIAAGLVESRTVLRLHAGTASGTSPWPGLTVLGGALELGIAVRLDGTGARLVALPGVAVEAAGLPRLLGAGSPTWAVLAEHLEAMGTLAAERLQREPDILRPMGDCDVVTLLASPAFREALAAGCPSGMRALVVPSRSRGWLDQRRLDSALASAAHALTDPAERAFDRPLLVTREEVALARPGGRPAEIDLRDPVRRLR